jgi:alkanesulfonate monooxygenase SsuD/methylene tetrahydromethanopterin reductase-like flavin-dependent oxidoreductase (luciferase family)
LQRLSAGRLELGLGLGYRDIEFDGLGLRRDRRGALMEAALDALEAVGARIWLGGMASRALGAIPCVRSGACGSLSGLVEWVRGGPA